MNTTNILTILKSRGLIAQESHPDLLQQLLSQNTISFYLGFDPTADSLHVGHLVPIITAFHLASAGHKMICLIGGGTALIGDPTGKNEMRKMLEENTILQNSTKIELQLKKVFSEFSVTFKNNMSWLKDIKYIEFLRDFGPIFKVNEMIKAETYRERLKRQDGLTFLEFNYQILQAFDFLHLYESLSCKLQIGGDDQWSNILAGVDLIRRKKRDEAFAITCPLLTTASGKKMGKTESGAIWLDPEKTSPYEFYQYWVNVDDRDVIRFLTLFTFIDLKKIEHLSKGDVREAKKVLAFELTKFIHGEKEAVMADQTSLELFSSKKDGQSDTLPENMPIIHNNEIFGDNQINIIELLTKTKLIESKSKARQLVKAGGIYVNNIRITNPLEMIIKKDNENSILIRMGKKKHYKIIKT